MIKVIVGPRRAGKSFFALHFLNKKGNFGYVNFDDEKLIEVNDYNEIITAMNSVYSNPKFVLFDEIQNLPKWELFVNRLQRQGYNLIINGSNSNLLSKELATHLTGRHLLNNIFPFSFKEQLSSNKKIYCIDNGFIQANSFKTSPDFGKLYENIVACNLKKQEIDGKLNFYYWKNQQQEEVDFVVKEGIKIKQLIQVCYNLNEINTKNREIRALIKASKELKCNNLLIITEGYEKEKQISWFGIKRKINFIPLWKWLLRDIS